MVVEIKQPKNKQIKRPLSLVIRTTYPCVHKCPVGLTIQSRMRDCPWIVTHARLSMDSYACATVYG